MKGVIVQVGQPKSIVLFNSGKIKAIPTPENCHVGMVVTLKLNNIPKIIIISIVAVILISLGIVIGAIYLGNTADTSPADYWRGERRHMHRQMREQWH